MEIYVVQKGDTVNSIAEKYGVPIDKLISDNGLEYPYDLVVGQAIIITYPKQFHIVQEGDTLQSIADTYHVTTMQILRNNPELSDRENLYVGEFLVISYNTNGSITINGFAFPFIKPDILNKTLPGLTYLSVFNYRTTENGEVSAFYDDTEIIKTSKDYGVIPLLLLSVLTPQGEPDIETAYKLLLNEEYQERNINEFIAIMKNKGYLGINVVFNLLSKENQLLYQNYVQRISKRLQQEGLLFLITINFRDEDINKNVIGQIDFSVFSNYVNGMIFIKLVWGTNYAPPGPVSNINNIRSIIAYAAANVPPDKIIVGEPAIGYDWQLPYTFGSSAVSLNLKSVMELAIDNSAVIKFDESSLTPYFYYNKITTGFPMKHIIWFIDVRSINGLIEIIRQYGLSGTGIWNIMVYFPQLWSLINSQFDIIKLL